MTGTRSASLVRDGIADQIDSIVCFSHLRWGFVFQRPQHLLTRAARGCRVWFVEEPVTTSEAAHVKRLVSAEGITVLTPAVPQDWPEDDVLSFQEAMVAEVMAEVSGECTLAWYYTPMALRFSRGIAADLIVYDNMDELSAFRGASPQMLELEQELLERADVVFTGGQSLYEAKKHRHRNIHPFPSSIDAAHFAPARARDFEEVAEQAAIPHPRLGFFGVIDERLDIELVAGVAERRPDWQLIMIGPVVKIDPATLPRARNTHWLGGKEYRDLPAYLAGWDVGLMPFALNEATRFISPTKTPEFLAAGLPVVSTPIADVVRPYGDRGLVEIAASADDFVAAVERILQAGERPEWAARVHEHLSSMSWDRTWAGMRNLMQQSLEAKAGQPVRPNSNLAEVARV